jgi:hypothetical protein
MALSHKQKTAPPPHAGGLSGDISTTIMKYTKYHYSWQQGKDVKKGM